MRSSLSICHAPETEDSEHWLSPVDLLTQLAIQPGMVIADIGAGNAFYSLPISDLVGPSGQVFAVEWRPWVLDLLHAGLSSPDARRNVRFVVGRAADTGLPAGSCDIVMLADIWHTLDDPDAVLDEARRILRPGGRLAVLNWRPDTLCPPGPPLEHRVPMQPTICAIEMKSWSLINVAGKYADGYLLIFEITDESAQS